jgi:hypothetical protein
VTKIEAVAVVRDAARRSGHLTQAWREKGEWGIRFSVGYMMQSAFITDETEARRLLDCVNTN